MKLLIIVFINLFCLRSFVSAQAPPPAGGADQPVTEVKPEPKKELLNQVLFSEGSDSWTSRDFALYRKVISTYLKKEKLSDYAESALDDFIISRLLKREALLFEISPTDTFNYNPSKLGPGEYSKKEIETELKDLAYAEALLNLKEKQMAQKARFKAWIDVLKRKYLVKIKTGDVTAK